MEIEKTLQVLEGIERDRFYPSHREALSNAIAIIRAAKRLVDLLGRASSDDGFCGYADTLERNAASELLALLAPSPTGEGEPNT